jgi:pilus assembly protein Flp/PilA
MFLSFSELPYGAAVRTPEGPKVRDYQVFSRDTGFLERNLPMRQFAQSVANFIKREDGPTAVEYAVMLALIVVVCITAITTLGSNASNTFTNVGTKIAGS